MSKQFTMAAFKSHGRAYSLIHSLFGKIPDSRAKNKSISLKDSLMSLFAIFVLKFSSLLKFEEHRNKNEFPSNMLSLFKIKKIPTDSQMRTIVDKIPPKFLHALFKIFFNIFQRGGLLKEFEFLKKDSVSHYLIAIDGIEYFSSKTIHCSSCMVKNHRNGTKTYYHQALAAVLIHPKKNQVIPLAVEEIKKQDGREKNDCEINAFKRLAKKLRKDYPKLGIIICGDALYANGKTVSILREHRMSYILNVKPKGNKKLLEHAEEAERKEGSCRYGTHGKIIGDKVKKKVNFRFRHVPEIPLDNGEFAKKFNVNFLECVETTSWKRKKRGI